MVSQTVMWTVDSAMVGHIGKTELAAVGLGGLLVFTINSFFVGLSYALNTFVSQNLGARNYSACARYMWQGIYLGLVAGVILLGVRLFNPWIVDLLGPPPEVRPLCVVYIDIRMLAAPFFILHYFSSNFFRGIGNTRTPMKVAIVANVLNIVIDYLLIFGKGPFPAIGVAGAAWATFIATAVSAVTLLVITFSARYRTKFATHRHWRFRIAETRSLLRVGLPIGVHYSLDIGCFLVFSAYIGRMGTDQLAANQIMIQILALSFMPCNGFAVAATTLMGQYIGAGLPDVAKRTGYQALRLGLVFTGAIALIYCVFPDPLIRIFNDDPSVIFWGKKIILLAALFQIFDGTQIIASGSLRGAGDTRVPMLLVLGGGWFLFLPLAYLFGTVLDGQIAGAWAGATIDMAFLASGMFLRLKTDRWRRIRLMKPAPATAGLGRPD